MRRMFPFPFWLVPLGFFFVLMAVFAVGPMSSTRRGGALVPIGMMIVMGIVVMTHFIRTYPRLEEGLDHGQA